MKATFNIKVEIDSCNVMTSFGSEKTEDMDTTLLASVLKVFGDVSNRVKKQVAQFYGVQKEQGDNSSANEETAETAETAAPAPTGPVTETTETGQ